MKTYIQRLAEDSWRGGLLKLIALAARLLFFILVVPRLPSGVLAGYVFANSVAIMGATALMLGLDEELPRVIGGDIAKARTYIRWFFLLSALGCTGLVLLTIFPSSTIAIVTFLLAVAAGRILAGIIRSIDARINENIQNLPWVAFIALAIVLELDQTVSLIAAMAASLLLVQYLGAYLVLQKRNHTESVPAISLRALIQHGLFFGSSRLATNFFLLGVSRAPILWPVWLGLAENLDQIAFAIAIGDIVAQFGRIPANHAYARWCRNPPMLHIDWRGAAASSALLSVGLFVFSSIAFAIAWQLGWLPRQAQNIDLQIQALLLSATVPGLRMLIYLVWSRGILAVWIATLTFMMMLFSVTVVYWIDIDNWFYALALITFGGGALVAMKSRSYFGMPEAGAV